jgi:hypothetical protein
VSRPAATTDYAGRQENTLALQAMRARFPRRKIWPATSEEAAHVISPTGIVPEELMYPEKLKDVMELLKAKTATGDWKREVLQGWARLVGVKISQAQYRAVFSTGWDVS